MMGNIDTTQLENGQQFKFNFDINQNNNININNNMNELNVHQQQQEQPQQHQQQQQQQQHQQQQQQYNNNEMQQENNINLEQKQEQQQHLQYNQNNDIQNNQHGQEYNNNLNNKIRSQNIKTMLGYDNNLEERLIGYDPKTLTPEMYALGNLANYVSYEDADDTVLTVEWMVNKIDFGKNIMSDINFEKKFKKLKMNINWNHIKSKMKQLNDRTDGTPFAKVIKMYFMKDDKDGILKSLQDLLVLKYRWQQLGGSDLFGEESHIIIFQRRIKDLKYEYMIDGLSGTYFHENPYNINNMLSVKEWIQKKLRTKQNKKLTDIDFKFVKLSYNKNMAQKWKLSTMAPIYEGEYDGFEMNSIFNKNKKVIVRKWEDKKNKVGQTEDNEEEEMEANLDNDEIMDALMKELKKREEEYNKNKERREKVEDLEQEYKEQQLINKHLQDFNLLQINIKNNKNINNKKEQKNNDDDLEIDEDEDVDNAIVGINEQKYNEIMQIKKREKIQEQYIRNKNNLNTELKKLSYHELLKIQQQKQREIVRINKKQKSLNRRRPITISTRYNNKNKHEE